MDGGDRIRLFCALRLPADVVDSLVAWQGRELAGRLGSGTRLVPPENLHFTLAFLGGRPAGELPEIAAALRTTAAEASDLRLSVRGYRETRSVGMLTFDDEEDRAGVFAGRLHGLLEELPSRGTAYRREARPWLPHVTVLRFGERPRLRPPLPELDTVAPSEAAVYISKLRPGGAQYEALEVVALGG